jgi:5-oxoprolinase (ATP-hydrolysing) subunit A
MKKTIDLNCDMGEGFGVYNAGDDAALLAHVTSANIACGFHAGDPGTMARTVRLAVKHSVAVGAHPGLPDLQGFGRRDMALSADEAYDLVVYQVGALQAVAAAAGTRVRHVKAHGALYNMAARDERLSDAIARAVRDVDASLLLYALAGSVTVPIARQLGLRVACEVFADRSYQDDGTLTPRRLPGAMITDLQQAIAQVRRMVQDGSVRALSGREISIEAHTVCVHGDQPGAVEFAIGLGRALREDGIGLRAPDPEALPTNA